MLFENIECSNLYVTQTGIYMEIAPYFSITLFIKNINKLDVGYRVTVKGNRKNDSSSYDGVPWFSLPHNFFDLILIHDGDYFNIVLAKGNVPVATFVRIDKSLLNELDNLMQTNAYDPANIFYWPRRADGSMDISSPVGYFDATHRTTDNLRLHSEPAISGEVIATIPRLGAVRQIETGPITTIDRITAPWVKVLSANGYMGWCFSGYLEAIAIPALIENIEDPIRGRHEPVVITQDRENGLPVSLLVTGGGAILLVAGVAMIIIMKRKRL